MASKDVVEVEETSIVPVTESGAIVGLEDMEGDSGATPRITIDHKSAEYRDNLSGISVPEFEGIILGLIKQRVLWPPEMSEDESQPLCKSINHVEGMPSASFPLKESGLTLVEGVAPNCGDCKLAEWDSHPTRKGPWCQEQFVLAVLADLEGDGAMAPALLTYQRSGLKAAKQYLGGFARKRQPAFSVVTKFALTPNKRGSVAYATPVISRLGETDTDMWEMYGENYLAIRSFLQTPRTDDAEEGASGTPKVTRDDDEIPEF